MEFPGKDINAHVIKLVRDTVRKYTSTELPDFDEICAGLGLNVREVPLPPERDGLMDKQRAILVNSRIQNQERKQFTRFHEVMHHLIDRDEELISILNEATWGQDGEYDRQIERLCNIGAAEFLMPREKFTKLYKEKGFNVELIPVAAIDFKSSAIATTIQLAQIAPHSCITAICEYGLIPNETSPAQGDFLKQVDYTSTKKLHVVYSASSPSMKYWLARYTHIPDNHIIHQAFRQSQSLEGESYVPFRTGKQPPCYCETLLDKDRVYVLFHRVPPPNPNQLTFF